LLGTCFLPAGHPVLHPGAGRASAQPLVEDLRAHRYAVLVLDRPASNRLPPQVLAAVNAHYRAAHESAARVMRRPFTEQPE
jgi:hypothetical protein